TVGGMAGHLGVLLRAMAAGAERALGELPLLSEAELGQLEEWNRTEVAFPRERCIHELFEEQAARTPAATAVVCGEERLSYGELNRRANRLGHWLRSLGVRPDEKVGLCLERSPEMVVGVLGILKAGGAYLPLDPSYPAERLGLMLGEAGARVAVTAGGCERRLPAGA